MVSLPTHHLMQGYPILGTDTSQNSGGSLQRWTGVVTPAAPAMPGSHSWSKTLQVPRRHFSWAMNYCREHTTDSERQAASHCAQCCEAHPDPRHFAWPVAVGGHPLPPRVSTAGPNCQQQPCSHHIHLISPLTNYPFWISGLL